MLRTDVNLIDILTVHEPPLSYTKHNVVARHLSLDHPPILAECPILKAITTLPLALIKIKELIPELHGNLVVGESKELFAQAVLGLALPFGCQEGYDFICALDKGGAVAPNAVFGICFGYEFWISTSRQELVRFGWNNEIA